MTSPKLRLVFYEDRDISSAVILSRAGVTGSGYLQEDEGFEKEPSYLHGVYDRPKILLVWNADYVDHVDEESLCASFEKFFQRVSYAESNCASRL